MFAFGLALDTVWVVCVHCVQRKWRHRAAISSVLLAAISGYGGARIAADQWLLVPELVGIGVGTYIGLALAQRLESREDGANANHG